jgi:hypothetical protein
MNKDRKRVFSENRKADPDNPYDGCVEDGCSGKYNWDFHYKNYVCGTCGIAYDAFTETFVERKKNDGKIIEEVKKQRVPNYFNKRDDGGSEFPIQKGPYRKLSQIDSKTRRHNSWSKNQRDKEFNKDFHGSTIEEYWNRNSTGLNERKKCELILGMKKHFILREAVITDTLYERGLFTSAGRSMNSYHIMEKKGNWIKKCWNKFTKDVDIRGKEFLTAKKIIKVSELVKENEYDVARILEFQGLLTYGRRFVAIYSKIESVSFLHPTIEKFNVDGHFEKYYELFESCEELSKMSGDLVKPQFFAKYVCETKKNIHSREVAFKFGSYKIAKKILEYIQTGCCSVAKLKEFFNASDTAILDGITMMEESNVVNGYRDVLLLPFGSHIESKKSNKYVFLSDDLTIFEKIPDFFIIKAALDDGFVRIDNFKDFSGLTYRGSISHFKKLKKNGFLDIDIKQRHTGKWLPTKKAEKFYESVKDGTFKGFDWLDSLEF